MSARALLSAALLVLLVPACAPGDSPVAPPEGRDALVPAARSGQVVDGTTGPGSLYRFVVPENWNGLLIVYAHGYVSPDEPVALPQEAELLAALLAPQGIALAYSSFSENGWVVKDGTQRTHQLLGLFASEFGMPARVYVGGASMGGLVAIKLVERYPGTYRGALAACSVAGGTRENADYRAHVRAVFDVLYPGVLPGSAAELPAGTDVETQIILPALQAMSLDLSGAFFMAGLDQTPLPWASVPELVESIVTALVGNAGDLRDEVLTRGKPYFDNSATVYSGAAVPGPVLALINASVDRFEASPAALAALDHDYDPSGDLNLPMLMLSNVRDPVVPGFNQASYLEAVTGSGAADLLVQRTVPRYGHCVFTPEELGTALSDLLAWAELGIVPTP
ncbi:MAG TPA: hypothetical protein VK858_06460 [Longimicrobiales bacterium]|nr:hypothetical protein [Longimicrobiales bacterium]